MNDTKLRADIIDELEFEPSIDAANIGVAANAGVVTLTGHVQSYTDKVTVIHIVETIRGVRAIADELEVRPSDALAAADDEIARRVLSTLAWNSAVPEDKIRVKVAGGRVTLEGDVDWRFQSQAAAKAVARLAGVTGVNNHIKFRPALAAADISDRIRRALVRDAELDASGIRVRVDGGTVTLEGKVRYLGERRAAERAAWSAPGVMEVVDHLSVR